MDHSREAISTKQLIQPMERLMAVNVTKAGNQSSQDRQTGGGILFPSTALSEISRGPSLLLGMASL